MKNIIKDVNKSAKNSFKNIIWPKKEDVKKEFLIVACGTVGVAIISFGVNTLAQFLLKLVF